MQSKRYYWLKLKRDFFKRHDIKIIESMPNGKESVLFYLKLLCESVDHNGELRFSEKIPYTVEMLATITGTDTEVAKQAIDLFKELELIEISDEGTFIMCGVPKMIGSAVDNDNAIRQQRYRDKQKSVTNNNANVTKSVTKSNEIKKEDKETKKETKPKKTQFDLLEKVIDGFNISEPMEEALVEWLKYKSQIKKPYTSEIGLKQLLKKIEEAEQKYGAGRVIEVIERTMSCSYQGIVWDWLNKDKKPAKKGLIDQIWGDEIDAG